MTLSEVLVKGKDLTLSSHSDVLQKVFFLTVLILDPRIKSLIYLICQINFHKSINSIEEVFMRVYFYY